MRDGVVRTRVERGHARGLTTVFGPITVERMAYRAPGAVNLHPADADWNTAGGAHSHGLARLAVIEAVRGSFDEAKAAVRRATGVAMGKRQLEQRGRGAAVDVAGFYAARRPRPDRAGHAAGDHLRRQGRHDAPRGAAASHRQGRRGRHRGRGPVRPAAARQPHAHGRDRVRLRHRPDTHARPPTS